MEEKKFYTCRYDRAFKEIFMREENKDILEKLLESILDVKIEKIEFLNLERNVDNLNIKRKHLDLYLETDIGHIQVEVNTSNEDYVKPRNMSYLCDIYSHHTLAGQQYDEKTLILQINFSYGIKNEEYIRRYLVQDHNKNCYVKNFVIYEINMDKYMKIWYTRDEKEIEKNKYLVMLNLELNDLKNLSKNDKVVSKYMSELERVNENPKFREYMSAEEDNRKIENSIRLEYIEKGKKAGLKEGSHNEKISIAKSLLENNVDIEIVSKSTGLSKEEIEKL